MDQVSRIETKLDRIEAQVSEIRETMGTATASLQYHIKRTDLLEAKVDSLGHRALMYLSIVGGLITTMMSLVKLLS